MFKTIIDTVFLETWQRSDFTFGFELEAFIEDTDDKYSIDQFNEFKTYTDEYFKNIVDGKNVRAIPVTEFDEPEDDLSWKDDDSIHPPSQFSPKSFEYASPIFVLKPVNVQSVIKFMKTAFAEYNVKTNYSCALHIHIGFPFEKTRAVDMFWTLCKLALDENQMENILHFGDYDLSDKEYADPDFLDKLRVILNEADDYASSEQSDIDDFFSQLGSYYVDNKTDVIRMHPLHGTFEWRGPRGFLDDNHQETISNFFMQKLFPFVKWITKTLDEEILIDNDDLKITREMFDKNLESKNSPLQHLDHNSFHKNMDKTIINELVKTHKWVVKGLREKLFTNALFTIENGNINILVGNFKDLAIDDATMVDAYGNMLDFNNCNINNCFITSGSFKKCLINNSKIHCTGPIYIDSTLLKNVVCDDVDNIEVYESSWYNSTLRKVQISKSYNNYVKNNIENCKIYDSEIQDELIIKESKFYDGNAIAFANLISCDLFDVSEIFSCIVENCNLENKIKLGQIIQTKFKNSNVLGNIKLNACAFNQGKFTGIWGEGSNWIAGTFAGAYENENVPKIEG